MSSDPTIGHLQALAPKAQQAAFRMVNHVRSVGVPLIVTSSVRTPADQAGLLALGRTRTLRSKHLTGRAFDVDVHGFARTAIPKWWFYQLGQLAEPLGLRWGGNFSGFWDPGHFEEARSIK